VSRVTLLLPKLRSYRDVEMRMFITFVFFNADNINYDLLFLWHELLSRLA